MNQSCTCCRLGLLDRGIKMLWEASINKRDTDLLWMEPFSHINKSEIMFLTIAKCAWQAVYIPEGQKPMCGKHWPVVNID